MKCCSPDTKVSFLHRIITGDEKWIYFKNPKCNRSYVDPGQPAELTPRQNCFGKKTTHCVFWDQCGVIWYNLKPAETVTGERYQQQLTDSNCAVREKHQEYLDDNAPSHRTLRTREVVALYIWESLANAAYSPHLAPSDYHLFSSMGNTLSEQRFNSYEKVRKWLDDCLPQKIQETIFLARNP